MLGKINVIGIVGAHLRTLREFPSNNLSRSDLFWFFGTPVIGTAILLFYHIYVSDALVTALLAAYSIITGLLFNILVLIFDVLHKREHAPSRSPADEANEKVRTTLLREAFANISYCVLLGIVLSFLCIVGMVDNLIVRIPTSALIYIGSANFLLTLLMVLKRIHSLLSHEITT